MRKEIAIDNPDYISIVMRERLIMQGIAVSPKVESPEPGFKIIELSSYRKDAVFLPEADDDLPERSLKELVAYPFVSCLKAIHKAANHIL